MQCFFVLEDNAELFAISQRLCHTALGDTELFLTTAPLLSTGSWSFIVYRGENNDLNETEDELHFVELHK